MVLGTAVFAAGVPFAQAQAELAIAGQRLALDPPLGIDDRATIGGIFASGDSGPLAHRYGTPRDQVLGVTVALSDGTIARSGSRVIKNVAGYDLPKLYAGSFGTLGAILAVGLRLRALPRATATVLGGTADPGALARAASWLARAPLELEALDVAWRSGRGGVLAQVAGTAAARRADEVAFAMRDCGLGSIDIADEDPEFWERQRGLQRSDTRAVVLVTGPRSALPAVLRLSDAYDATMVGRAALGVSYLTIDPEQVAPLRAALPAGLHAVVLDRPDGFEGDTWAGAAGPEIGLMRAVKAQFDPAGVCNPGLMVGGI
jgi:glycolate oxidase FAD binding subunit